MAQLKGSSTRDRVWWAREPHTCVMLLPVDIKETAPETGFDDYERHNPQHKIERPWLMVPGHSGAAGNSAILEHPGTVPLDLEIDGEPAGTTTDVQPQQSTQSPETFTVTSSGEHDSSFMKVASSWMLDLAVYDKVDITLAVHAITLINDDVDNQSIAHGQGSPNSTCIQPGSDGIMWTTSPSGDDQISGNTITTGQDGICDTTAHPNENQLIDPGNGQPNVVFITPGPNGILETKEDGDDTVTGQSMTTGPDGIRDTQAPTPQLAPQNVPTTAELQQHLDPIFVNQANIHFQVLPTNTAQAAYDIGDQAGANPEFTAVTNRGNGYLDVHGLSRTPEEDIINAAAFDPNADFNLYFLPTGIQSHLIYGTPPNYIVSNDAVGLARAVLGTPYIAANGPDKITLLHTAAHELGHNRLNGSEGLPHPRVNNQPSPLSNAVPLKRLDDDKKRLMWENNQPVNPETGRPPGMLIKHEWDVLHTPTAP